MRIEEELKLDFKDVLFRPKRSTLGSRAKVDLLRQYTFRHSGASSESVPIIAANMDTVGTFEMAAALGKHGMHVALHKHYSIDDYVAFFNASNAASNAHAFYSLGILEHDLEKFKAVRAKTGDEIKFVCIDVANGYTETFIDFVRKFRDAFPKITMMAGNVVTADITEALILAGADIVKVGIGPGSVCTTRKMTGVGYPQLSAIIECADAAHGLGGHITGDGGCTVPGDVAKAFGAGADFVMLGGMLAAHDESGGEIVQKEGKTYRKFYGMSSDVAMEKYAGGVAKYRASEGKAVTLEARGPVDNTVQEILGGLRSTCTYVGARKLKDLSKCTTFVRVTQQINEVYGKAPQ
ncbi:MAG: GMP reductase [Betaproteobacteria bacterium]|nr:MAG: GMP reductase [Betaproteobacteria bacterium]TAG47979.1 MAG: GMP reductase [Betaproteobacteria bacterium]